MENEQDPNRKNDEAADVNEDAISGRGENEEFEDTEDTEDADDEEEGTADEDEPETKL